MSGSAPGVHARFRAAYAEQRAAEGRGARDTLLELPWVGAGPHAASWAVRAATFAAFLERVVRPRATAAGRPLSILDLGAGNGWLCYRLALVGHDAVALDIRDDDVDGLGAAAAFAAPLGRALPRIAASFDALPLRPRSFDVAVFNASLHYAESLDGVLTEACRVVAAGGAIAILDSPFYQDERDGHAMVAEKHAGADAVFGERAADLLALPFIEFVTPGTLARASAPLGLPWRRHAVQYPLWYELRPFVAVLRRQRMPSRFDVWEATVP